MSYIWQKYNENKKFKIPKRMLSPYIEVWDNDRDDIEVNFNYRFIAIFREFIKDSNFTNNDEAQQIINILFHFLANLDRKKGFDKEIAILEIIEYEIISGLYGETVKNYFESLNNKEKRIILRNLKKYNEDEQRKCIFINVIKEMFIHASIYNFVDTNKSILCIFNQENEKNLNKFKLICELFLDMNQKIEVIWNKNIGIIGMKSSMKIGQFIIY